MESIVAALSIGLILVILAVFARDLFARSWDLFSWRNLFLVGFVHFYCLSAYFTATGTTLPEFLKLTNGGWSNLAFTMVLFLVVFLVSARLAFRRPALTRIIPKFQVPVTGPALITSILALSALGLVFSIPIFNYFGVIAAQVRGQLSACAVGLAVYYLLARRFNPMAWLLLLTALAMGAVSSTVGLSGRRLFLGVLLAGPWMWYFVVWRYRSAVSNALRLSIFSVLGVVAIIMYSPLRGEMDKAEDATMSMRADQFVDLVTNPRIDTAVIKHILYTDTVPNTLYILLNYPGNHEFMPFHGLKWFLANPIPRSIWAGKPEALGGILRDQMNVVPNLGPGIIGHGWSEAWVMGVVYYAVFLGLFVGIVDRACADRCWNPYFMAVMGANLGNVIALPRGDTPLFLIQIVSGVFSCGVVLYVINILSPIWSSFRVLTPPGEATQAAPAHLLSDADIDADASGETPGQHHG